MNATVRRWGNSLALRVPKAVANGNGLREGSVVDLVVRKNHLTVRPSRRPKYTLDVLLAGVSQENLHESVATGPAVGREV